MVNYTLRRDAGMSGRSPSARFLRGHSERISGLDLCDLLQRRRAPDEGLALGVVGCDSWQYCLFGFHIAFAERSVTRYDMQMKNKPQNARKLRRIGAAEAFIDACPGFGSRRVFSG